MSRVTFRPFTSAFIPQVAAMMQDFYAIDNYPFEPATAIRLLEEFIADGSLGKGWVILLDGEISGYAILTFVFSFEYKGRIAFLDELFIAAGSRGKGLGKQVLDFIRQEAVLLDLQIIYLETEKHNEAAQKLYTSNGFIMHNRLLMKMVV